jgi:phenylacetate-CoA ligase
LVTVISTAAAKVPFYRERLGLADLGSIREPADLVQLPFVTKREVIDAGLSMINVDYHRDDMVWHPTSGSTGLPLQVPTAPYVEQMEWAFIWARWLRGIIRGSPYASFTGLSIVPPERKVPPFWLDNWANNQRMYSIFHMSEDHLEHYVADLDGRYSKYFIGYSSAIYQIAAFLLSTGRALRNPPERIFVSSEELQPHYRSAIEQAFGAKVVNRYGMAEMCASITEYECGRLHCDEDYSIIELVPVGSEEDGVVAEIVVTSMHDTTWPLIRYRTGDLVVYDPNETCCCGRPGRVIRRIQGRTGSFFRLKDGRRISNISVIAKRCTRIRGMQVREVSPGVIDVTVIRDPDFCDRDETALRREFQRKLGADLVLQVTYVDRIPLSRNGKFMSIVPPRSTEPSGSAEVGGVQ